MTATPPVQAPAPGSAAPAPPPAGAPGAHAPDLRYHETEEELRAVVRQLFDDRCAWPEVLARLEAGEPTDTALWHALAAELGWACSSPKATAAPAPVTGRRR